MSPRIFLGWLVVTVVTVVLAVVIGLGRETSTFDLVKRDAVFAELRANPDSAARVVIESRFGAVNLVREGDDWISPERDGYPVQGSDVRRLVSGLADMRFVERKTANPARFHRLEVQDITEEFADSAQVSVTKEDGGVMADVIVGRPSARFFEGRSSGTYIRFPGTNDVWLVTGVTNVQTRLVPWLARTIVSVPADSVARIAIGEAEGAYALTREKPEDAFAVEGAPEGRKADPDKVRPVSRALANVELEDVKPHEDLELPADAQVAEFQTFDGLLVRMRMAEIDKKRWAVFEASYAGDVSDESDAARAARAAAQAINERVADWVYWIPSAVFSNMTQPVEDVLADAENAS